MNDETAQALHEVNRDFYRARAAEFSSTRRRPWPGWARALEVYRGRRGARAGGSILDLGCGNGRLGAFLGPALAADHRYLGIDASLGLLAEARRFPGGFPRARFGAADLITPAWPLARLDGSGFSWIAAFGLLHHIAGAANRCRFMARIGRLLAPGGVATVSFWQFADHSRFRRRAAGWRGFDEGQLEPGDFLLRWGEGDALRYCHHVDDAEASDLAAASGLERVAAYRSDGEGGALNLYLVLARAAAPPLAAAGDG